MLRIAPSAWWPNPLLERRRTLRYRNLLVWQMVQMKNKIGMLMMQAG
jgi:hypothetical protein